MYNTADVTNERINNLQGEIEKIDSKDFELGNSELGIGIIMVMAALVGLWGAACLISGLANSSFQEIGRGLLTAVTGM